VRRTLGKEARRHVGGIDGQAVLKRLFAASQRAAR
jgi:hypothetical protein